MAGPKFLQRVARLPEVINVLRAYPDGLPLSELAAQFGVDVETMREDLVTYLDLESWGWSFDIFRKPALEFVQPEAGYATDGSGGTIVRIVPDAAPGLGVDHLSAGDLATLYTAGSALLEVDPDDGASGPVGGITELGLDELQGRPAEDVERPAPRLQVEVGDQVLAHGFDTDAELGGELTQGQPFGIGSQDVDDLGQASHALEEFGSGHHSPAIVRSSASISSYTSAPCAMVTRGPRT